MVNDQEQFEKLWKGWKVEDKAAPKIDFDKHFVFVYANEGTKHTVGRSVSDTGVLWFVIVKGEKFKSTVIVGFHYQIVVVKKTAVKGLREKPAILNVDTNEYEQEAPATVKPFAETKRQPKFLTNSTGMKLARIEAGEFMMGNHETARAVAAAFNEKEESFYSEAPLHRVNITRPFYLGCCEVGVGQFAQFVRATGYKTDAERQMAKATSLDPNKGAFNDTGSTAGNWRTQSEAINVKERARHPVVMVSWNDAQAFCKWLSDKEGRTYRLPSEAEWEYACRAGTTTRYWNGDDPEDLVKIANVPDRSFLEEHRRKNEKPLTYATIKGDDGYAGTAPVGSFQANPWGLHDMHGNVWEWCNDWYGADYYKRARLADPRGLAEGDERVIRGGCYM